MRQSFASLACLLKGVSKAGKSSRWDLSDIKYQGEYVQPWGKGQTPTSKQFVGEFELTNGAKVIIRSFGTYNSKLWDDVMSDFAPITANDVILVNFGAWCGACHHCPMTCPSLAVLETRRSITDHLSTRHLSTRPLLYVPCTFCGLPPEQIFVWALWQMCPHAALQVPALQDHGARGTLGAVEGRHDRHVPVKADDHPSAGGTSFFAVAR